MIPNQWYPILEARKLVDPPMHLRRLGMDLVLWRRADGRIVLQHDRCPHKGVRLSEGRLVDGNIQCPYHGFQFDAQGTCITAPCVGSRGKIPKTMRVETLDARDEHGLIWMWYGDASIALDDRPPLPYDPSLRFDNPIRGDMSYDRPVHYTRYIESLLEFYHVPWVHRDRWYNAIDHIAVGGLRPGAKKRYYDTCTVANSECTIDGQRINYSYDLIDENNPSSRSFHWSTAFVAPNLCFVDNREFTAAQWCTPIDEENTHVIFRWVGFKLDWAPKILQKALTAAVLVNQRYGQDYQDYLMMKAQEPKISDVGVNVFTAADELNAQYLHMRRRLIREADNGRTDNIIGIRDPKNRGTA